MKKILLLSCLVLFIGLSVTAQRTNGQRMRLLKTNFITNALDLTPEEAQTFWPVYNKYNKTIMQSKNQLDRGLIRTYVNGGTIDDLTEEQAQQFLQDIQFHEKEIYNAKSLMFNDLQNILSSKKLIKLMKAENDFNRRILQEFGRRRGMERKN